MKSVLFVVMIVLILFSIRKIYFVRSSSSPSFYGLMNWKKRKGRRERERRTTGDHKSRAGEEGDVKGEQRAFPFSTRAQTLACCLLMIIFLLLFFLFVLFQRQTV